MRNRQFVFAPKIEYQLVAERSEANQNSLTFPTWCWRRDSVTDNFAKAKFPRPRLDASSRPAGASAAFESLLYAIHYVHVLEERLDPYRISTLFTFSQSRASQNMFTVFESLLGCNAGCILPSHRFALCWRRDSNSQTLRYAILSRTCIPFHHSSNYVRIYQFLNFFSILCVYAVLQYAGYVI